uniref:Peptidase S8/S53 domain-containing protein n=1 Tax=Manihot esculenta TaxID=3983 RepID=A0A2C9W2U1_MANES
MAPGVDILAAVPPLRDEPGLPIGKKPSNFGLKSGTYMACPHASGAAAFIKSVHPNWRTSMIKSALMTTEEDYLHFLCYYGYSETKVKNMTKTKFKCPKGSRKELISMNINHPSISIGKLDQNNPTQIVKRKVTNVGSTNASYESRVYAPMGLMVKVSPNKITEFVSFLPLMYIKDVV